MHWRRLLSAPEPNRLHAMGLKVQTSNYRLLNGKLLAAGSGFLG